MKIKLLYKYLKHDVDQRTFRAVEAKMEPGQAKDALQIGEESSDASYVVRWIEAAMARLRIVLAKRMATSFEDGRPGVEKVTDDTISVDGLDSREWVLDLEDDGRYQADQESLTELCHEFVVSWVMAQWANDMMPDMVGVLSGELEGAMSALEDAAFRRSAPMKRRPKFGRRDQWTVTVEDD